MYLPIPYTKPRKWMRVVVKAIENRWFDDYGEFYTYAIKNTEIVEVVDEEELATHIKRSVRDLLDEGYTVYEMREQIAIAYGIPETCIELILDRVKVELGLVEVRGMLVEP
jgi:hypothetical protein